MGVAYVFSKIQPKATILAIISLLVMLAFLGVSTIAYGGISLFIIVPIIIATGFLVKEVS